MDRNQALDLLAMNLHEYPYGLPFFVKQEGGYGLICRLGRDPLDPTDYMFTREEWIQRRKELQGKPSWQDIPEWVQIIAQWSDGEWLGYEVVPEQGNRDDQGYCYSMDCDEFRVWRCGNVGEVLGDWRDTLERRPIRDAADKSSHDEVSNPAHYDLFPGQQSIDVIKAALTQEEWAGFLKGNIINYRLLAGKKGPAEKCLANADWYQSKLWEQDQ